MPPQQPGRLLDLGDDILNFGAHIRYQGERIASRRQRMYIVAGSAQINQIFAAIPDP
jgi:hypothetical protein